jgi:hypothetical protein
MCGEHRSVRHLPILSGNSMAGEGVRGVSTQVVEAGVDVDFPVV